jgi:hypothetical protein
VPAVPRGDPAGWPHPARVRRYHPLRWDAEPILAANYEIRIRGKVGESLVATFKDMHAAARPAETVLRGSVVDQAELHGPLERIQLLGLELVEIRQVSDDST